MVSRSTKAIICLIVLATLPRIHGAENRFDHTEWGQLLQKHVVSIDGDRATQVDYAAFLGDIGLLNTYLGSLSVVSEEEFNTWSLPDQLAFLINAYNAWTVSLILTEYPALDSIRDLGNIFRSPWRKKFVSLFGEQVSLDYIEHELIRGRNGYREPRIHFAVNCASIGCPALRWEAYVGPKLNDQLDDATRLFLSDRSRNRLDGNFLYVSRIFDWYREDFQQGWHNSYSVKEFLSQYGEALELCSDLSKCLVGSELRVRFLDYDWGLNDAGDI